MILARSFFFISFSSCFITLGSTLFYTYRLSGGTQQNNGYVEVRFLGTWSLLCGNGISSTAASKICESVGHATPGTVVSSVSGFSKPATSVKVSCGGYTGVTEVCAAETPIPTLCDQSQGVVIQCSDREFR